jgi:endoribonuclease Dicer
MNFPHPLLMVKLIMIPFSLVARRPKILGLTAALFRKRCKPREVRGVIKQLSESMGCIVRIPSDVQTVYR